MNPIKVDLNPNIIKKKRIIKKTKQNKTPIKKDNNYSLSMHRTHMSIGFAMYYTSVTIIVGFCILIFSNFIPSIYFGILTSIAMLMALLSSLILLPQLLILFKPFEN